MDMKTFYLIRHGDITLAHNAKGDKLIYNLDVPANTVHLSEIGIAQMEALGQKLAIDNVKFDALLASPYARTRESAEIIQRHLHLAHVDIVNDLHDVYAPGYISWTKARFVKEVGGDIYGRPT